MYNLKETYCNSKTQEEINNETIEQYLARISTGMQTITEEQYMQMRD